MSTPKQGPSPAKPTEPSSSVDKMFLAKALLLVCALQFFALSYFIYDKKKNRPVQPPNDTVLGVVTKGTSANTDNHFQGNAGPWGELEYVRINIVSPEDYLPAQLKNMPPTQWHFAGYDSEKLASLIRSCNLPADQQAELLDQQKWTVSGNDIILTPAKELVLGLPSSARSQLYSVLAQNPANRSQQWPYTFRQNGFEEWFENSGVSLPNQALIKKLTYQRGN
ncbi:MAG: hypothetical protein K0Q55_2081, partial [Verrucomicrobia bacterium]|nr:hypothetical protein [Verrucomicrobiota bacterium]